MLTVPYLSIQALDYRISFALTGFTRTPDSILVENLTQDNDLTLMRDDILHLVNTVTGYEMLEFETYKMQVYPNPMNGMATLDFYNAHEGRIKIEVCNVTGEKLVSKTGLVPQGMNKCNIAGLPSGFYVVSVTTDLDKYSIVLVSGNTFKNEPSIEIKSEVQFVSGYAGSSERRKLKSAPSELTRMADPMRGDTTKMQYNEGDLLRFTGYLSDKNAVRELIPTADDTISFDFSVYAPVADFTSDTNVVAVDSLVRFTDLSTNDPAGWRWDFGDGTPLVFEPNPTHVYKDTGSYTVRLVAISAFGSSVETKASYIKVVNDFDNIEKLHSPWELTGAEARIDSIRKGEITLQYMLPDSSMLSDSVPVHVELDKHEFKFGVSMSQGWAIYDKPDFEKYRMYIGELFNYVNLGFYWSWIERNMGHVIINEHTLDNLAWAKARNMTVKGHPLLWHNTVPDWLKSITNTEDLDQIIRDHVQYLLMEVPEIDEWDVYNEAVAAFKSHTEESGVTRWVSYMGGVNPAVESLFSLVDSISSDKVYINNHYTHTDPAFKELNQHLITTGAGPDAIGIQTHMHKEPDILNETELWDILDEYSTFDKPVYLSEVTVLSSEPFSDWRELQEHEALIKEARMQGLPSPFRESTPELEQYQADYLSDFYTLAFSHPGVQSVIYWTGTDLDAWRGSAGGLLDMKHNPKPAYQTLKSLIKEKWNTNIREPSGSDGTFTFRGFYGDYKGTITVNETDYYYEFTHSSDSDSVITIKLDSVIPQRPNIILVMADDLSPRWFGIYGEQDNISTPNIDRLAFEGVCFRTAWATPMCTPTRSLIMTGQYGMRTGWLHNELTIPDHTGNIDFQKRGSKTFAQILKNSGYRTAFCSRWGIPASRKWLLPEGVKEKEIRKVSDANELVLDAQYEMVVSLDSILYDGKEEASFMLESETGYGHGPFYSRYWYPAIVQNNKLLLTEPEDFAIDLYVDFIIDFFDRTKDQPSLVYLPLHIPHGTSVNVQKGISPLPTTPISGRPGTNYNGNMKEVTSYIDLAMGNLIAGLDSNELLENTIIIFTGDNADSGDPTGLKPGKIRATDHGARVPFIAWGPGLVKQRGLTDELCELSDILPTLADYARAEMEDYLENGNYIHKLTN